MKNKLHMLIRGGYVERYHTMPTITHETIGHHSYTVAWLVEMLSRTTPRAELLLAALQHDNAEYMAGDMPGDAKREMGLRAHFAEYEASVLKHTWGRDYATSLTPAETSLLCLADSLAGMLLCVHERRLGNQYIAACYTNFRSYSAAIANSSLEFDLIDTIDKEWGNANGK